MLRVDLEDFEENIANAEYNTFKVADEADKYRLTLGEYNGTAGDSFMFQRYRKYSRNTLVLNVLRFLFVLGRINDQPKTFS